jgi:hypothetical protein
MVKSMCIVCGNKQLLETMYGDTAFHQHTHTKTTSNPSKQGDKGDTQTTQRASKPGDTAQGSITITLGQSVITLVSDDPPTPNQRCTYEHFDFQLVLSCLSLFCALPQRL